MGLFSRSGSSWLGSAEKASKGSYRAYVNGEDIGSYGSKAEAKKAADKEAAKRNREDSKGWGR